MHALRCVPDDYHALTRAWELAKVEISGMEGPAGDHGVMWRAVLVFARIENLCHNQRIVFRRSAGPGARFVPKWRNWQTRMVQVHVPARVWGFESLLRHHELFAP